MNVVNLRTSKYDIYIGRKNATFKLEKSKWSNPFVIGRDGEKEEVVKKYKEWILGQQNLLDDLHELDGKTLGCWCNEKPCHGDVLIELRQEQLKQIKKPTEVKNEDSPLVKKETIKKYKIAVIGSRDYNDKEAIFRYLESKINKISMLVSGGCPNGADYWANEFAKKKGLSILIHYPEWYNENGVFIKGAGFHRNYKIVRDSDIVIAWWTGSKGTENTIQIAKKQNKQVIIHKVEPDKKSEDII